MKITDLKKLALKFSEISGGKMLRGAIWGLAAYAASLSLFLIGVYLSVFGGAGSIIALVIGGVLIMSATVYQLAIAVISSLKIYRGIEKKHHIISLIISLSSIVLVSVLVFLMISEIFA